MTCRPRAGVRGHNCIFFHADNFRFWEAIGLLIYDGSLSREKVCIIHTRIDLATQLMLPVTCFRLR